jgi:ABC-type branched-subunit amino acid transport system permease subunit
MFRSLPLTYVGGIVVGLAASLATKYFTDAPWNGLPPAIPFIILLIVLLVVPGSRFPQRRSSLRSLIPDRKPLSSLQGGALAVPLLGALLLVPTLDNVRLPIWTAALSYLLVFGSLALLVWTSGQISLCHAGFVAVGAVSMSQLTSAGLPWALALVLAGLITVPVGALVAIPAIRLPGIYLALATLGFGLLLQQVFYPTSFMFTRQLSVSAPRPSLGPLDGTNDTHFYLLVLTIALIGLAAIVAISRSRLGRLLRALSETPTMLVTHGLGINVTRLIVFCISAYIAGVAGALILSQFGSVSGTTFGPIQSLIYLAVLAICGTRLVRSSVLAAGLFSVVPGYMTSFDVNRQILAFGLAAVAAGLVIAKRDAIDALTTRGAAPREPALDALDRYLDGDATVREPDHITTGVR